MSADTEAPAGIVVEGATKRFGGVTAVEDASFEVEAGTIHGLIGPNGAGKSTLISLISGFQRADSGTVRLAGIDLGRLSPVSIARLGLARTFQAATPFVGLSVRENLQVGLHAEYASGVPGVLLHSRRVRRENREVVQRSEDLLVKYGLESVADRPAGELPFGQLRFLEIARAVARRPRALLLDEPAAGLNEVETRDLADLLRRISEEGTTVLVIDHDVPFMFALCGTVTVMNFGHIIASGAPAEISRNSTVRAAYLGGNEEKAAS